MSAAEFIILGGGPAAISAAWPLVTSGRKVLMLEAGPETPLAPSTRGPDLAGLRQGQSGAWRHLLKPDLSALAAGHGQSPKLRTAMKPNSIADYVAANRIESANFRTVGALSAGGLSTVWGAVVAAFNSDEFSVSNASHKDLENSYRHVAKRIGVSGIEQDDVSGYLGKGYPLQEPIPLSSTAQTILDRYAGKGAKAFPDFRLGRVRNAVLSREQGGRLGCYLCKGCMWGCAGNAIYNSAREIPALKKYENFQIQYATLAQEISQCDGGNRVTALTASVAEPRVFTAKHIVVATGTLATTRLVLDLMKAVDTAVPLLNTPCVALAFSVPRRLGAPLDSRGYGMAQLAFRQTISGPGPETDAFGLLYDADAVSAVDILMRSPLSFHGSRSLMRSLMPTMMLAILYFPSSISANTARLKPTGRHGVLELTGGVSANFKDRAKATTRRVASAFRACAAWQLPFSFSHLDPGADSHYGGTLPMGKSTSEHGELHGYPGIHIVDGSILPNLPAKNLTFTIMANADRIGRYLAAKV